MRVQGVGLADPVVVIEVGEGEGAMHRDGRERLPNEILAQPLCVRDHQPSPSQIETLIIRKLDFNQNYYTFTLISLINVW